MLKNMFRVISISFLVPVLEKQPGFEMSRYIKSEYFCELK